MKLSMWVLLDELGDMSPRAEIRDGKPILEDFRIWHEPCPRSDKYVYISSPEKGTITLFNGSDAICLENASLFYLINRICAVFEKYRDWDSRLRSAFDENSTPLQSAIDVAHDIFRCPMIFGSIDRHLYALTAQYDEDEVFYGWNEVKALHCMPFNLNEKLSPFIQSSDKIAASLEEDQAVEPVWEGMNCCHQIRTNCYMGGKVWGHFYLYYKKQEVSPAVLQLARHVGNYFSEWIEKNSAKTSPRYFKYSWLIDVLNGLQPSENAILTLYQSLGWQKDDSLILYKIDSSNRDYDRMMFYWLCDSIDSFTKAIVFPYGHSIVAVVRSGEVQSKIMLEGISRLISFNSYHCGVSFPFTGLHKILPYFRQAGYAIEHAPDSGGKIHHYSSCMLEGIARELRGSVPDYREWLLPALRQMVECDRENGKDYGKTLYNYILRGSIADTAQAMHIHRNTLVYRLEKIRQSLGIDFSSSKISAYLLLCFMLLDDEAGAEE